MSFRIKPGNDEKSIVSLETLMQEHENTVIPEKNPQKLDLVYKTSGHVVAGAQARIICGNCFVSSLFVIPSERRQGLGSSLLNEIRAFQTKCGATTMSISTRDVRTKRFLDEREMVVDGRIRHCPASHTFAFYSGTPRFKKVDIPASHTLKKNVEITEDDVLSLRGHIEADLFQATGSLGLPITFTLIDDEGEIRGGLNASVRGDCLEIKSLIVSPSIRKRGYGKKLLETIETYAGERKIGRLFVRPFCFHDRTFFSHMGYRGFTTPCHDVLSKSL